MRTRSNLLHIRTLFAAILLALPHTSVGATAFTRAQDFPGLDSSSVAWCDYDADNRMDLVINRDKNLDLALAGYTGKQRVTSIMLNTTPSMNLAPTALTASTSEGSATLTWNTGSDVETPRTALTYNVWVGTSPGGADVVSPLAAPAGTRLVAEPGNCGQRLSLLLTNLQPRRYYWSVQTIDSSWAASSWAPENNFLSEPQP